MAKKKTTKKSINKSTKTNATKSRTSTTATKKTRVTKKKTVAKKVASKKSTKKPLKKVFRLAGRKDFLQKEKNIVIEKQAFAYCVECLKRLKLDMNLFSVEAAFDQSRLTFFFTSVGRVDFRQLIKMLVKKFKVMIAMKQVGIRSKAKMCGGIGRCGRTTCCSSFMEKFSPVSIRMAKDQHLSLNPTKISGLCGRLMCCLTFEDNSGKHPKKKTAKKPPPTKRPKVQ